MLEIINLLFLSSKAFSDKNYFRINFFWQPENFFTVLDIKDLLDNTLVQITKENQKQYQRYYLDLMNLLFFNFYPHQNYSLFRSYFLEQFLVLNLQSKKQYLIFEGVTSGLIKKDLLIGYLLCEIGSRRKLFFVQNIAHFAQKQELFKMVGITCNKVILQTGLEILKREYGKNKLPPVILQGIIRDYHLKNFLIREYLSFSTENKLKMNQETKQEILDLCKSPHSNLALREAEIFFQKMNRK